jgi:hypothetical protein
MSASADDELLSAYLDGELTAEERSRVEQALAERPESRQLLEDLRSIKAGLERMPRDRLGQDFADQVLHRAEKELLLGGDDGTGGQVPPTTIDLAGRASPESGLSWRRARRPLIWASLTVAAGLVIMRLEGQRQAPPHRQVAQAPGEAGERGHGEIGAPAEERGPAGPASSAERSTGQNVADEGLGRRSQTRELEDGMHREGEVSQEVLSNAIEGDQTLVVWCDVAAEADYRETLRELLDKENIQLDEAKVSGKTLDLRSAGDQPDQVKLLLKRADPSDARRLAEAKKAVRDPNTELVLVAASQSQVEAVLAALDRDDEVFVNVDVEPAADAPRQRSLRRYRRGAVADKLGRKDEKVKQEPSKAVDETPAKRAPAAARANDEDRLQVLFVLHPMEAKEPSKGASPPEEKND